MGWEVGPEAAGPRSFSLLLPPEDWAVLDLAAPPHRQLPQGPGCQDTSRQWRRGRGSSPAELLTLHHARGQCRFMNLQLLGFVGLGGA